MAPLVSKQIKLELRRRIDVTVIKLFMSPKIENSCNIFPQNDGYISSRVAMLTI